MAKYNKGKRELIMHRDVKLVAVKSSNKLKYLKLEERKLKTAKKNLYTVLKDLFNQEIENFVSYTF